MSFLIGIFVGIVLTLVLGLSAWANFKMEEEIQAHLDELKKDPIKNADEIQTIETMRAARFMNPRDGF